MKELVQQKRGPLYVVNARRSASDLFDFSPLSLDRSFQGWLSAVEASTESQPRGSEDLRSNLVPQKRALQLCRPVAAEREAARPGEIKPAVTLLTTQEYISVMLATIREGVRHVRWPKEVVARFLATDVIARRRDNTASEITLLAKDPEEAFLYPDIRTEYSSRDNSDLQH